MFSIISSNQELLSKFTPRKIKIKNTSKLPYLDDFYINFLKGFEQTEITPDINILGYENSLNENNYILKNYPDISRSFWLVGESGQGDSWFLDKNSDEILFYDHNNGDFDTNSEFINLKINFYDFLRMGFLYRGLEKKIGLEKLSKSETEEFKNELNKINPSLFSLYPYEYF